MNAAWTDVAQDAVKIGLGAVIGLLGNGLLAKRIRDQETADAKRLARKADFTEVERLLNTFRVEFSKFYDALRNYQTAIQESKDHERASIKHNLGVYKQIAANALNDLVGVDSKLSLWGEEKALKAFRKFSEAADTGLEELWDLRDSGTQDEFDEKTQKTFDLRNALYKELGLIYQAIE